MKQRFQFGAWACGLGLNAALLLPCAIAQSRQSNERPPARQQPAPTHQANPPRNERPSGSYHPQNIPRAQNAPRGGNANRQPAYPDRGRANDNRPRGNENPRAYDNGRENRNDRPQSSYRQQGPSTPAPNAQERLRNMSPQERNRLAENQRKFNQLPPQKQQDMKRAAENWRRMTPEQQNHIRNDVLPRWQQLPADRQRAIQQRLGVLQNMPESARNRHLNDPNFTRGMSDEDRQMLRDLSHEHVGAPDQPQEQ
jgi:Protein of unknown function (DUF3106)